MSFISYAQNFEDVMIWRALKQVENGFYIDVGANDPTLYSVTRAFYDKGWRGINLEPVPEFFHRLTVARPRDINLQIGASETAGSLPFFDIPDTGLATSQPAIAQKHRDSGWEVHTIDIPVLPLSDVCQEHVQGEIHFLKIDVEGAEKSVLLGMDFKKWRPWLLIVEATVPSSQETIHQDWEPLVIASGYDFVYFDGLNRYYVAQEHPEIKPAFATPPNVFDGFVLNADQEAKMRAAEAEAIAHRARQHAQAAEHQVEQTLAQSEVAQAAARAAEVVARLAQANASAAEAATQKAEAGTRAAEAHAGQLANQIVTIHASTSWRITRPLRVLKQLTQLRWAQQADTPANQTTPRIFLKKTIVRAMHWVAAKPQLRIFGQRMLVGMPVLEKKIKALSLQTNQHTAALRNTVSGNHASPDAELPGATRRVLLDIQRVVGKQEQ